MRGDFAAQRLVPQRHQPASREVELEGLERETADCSRRSEARDPCSVYTWLRMYTGQQRRSLGRERVSEGAREQTNVCED